MNDKYETGLSSYTAKPTGSDILEEAYRAEAERDGRKRRELSNSERQGAHVTSNPSETTYESTYGTARIIAGVVAGVGWFVIFIGILGFLVSSLTFFAPNEIRGIAVFGLIGFLPSTTALIIGLFLVSHGQLTRSAVDTANFSGEMLAIMKAERKQTIS